MMIRNVIKTWSSTQAVVALSSGEAEYYGLVKSGAQSLGMKAVLQDLGIHIDIVLKTDASAAKGIGSRKGLGKVRHLEVSQLWLQDKVARKDLEVEKVEGKKNRADALTKHVPREGLEQHLQVVEVASS